MEKAAYEITTMTVVPVDDEYIVHDCFIRKVDHHLVGFCKEAVLYSDSHFVVFPIADGYVYEEFDLNNGDLDFVHDDGAFAIKLKEVHVGDYMWNLLNKRWPAIKDENYADREQNSVNCTLANYLERVGIKVISE